MLKQNGTLYSQYPLRFTGGAAAGLGSASRDTYQTCGKYRNQWCGQGGLDQRAGIPVGYRSGKAILLPLKDGGLGCTNRALGTGTLTAGIAGGRNAGAALAGVGALLGDATARAHIVAALLGQGDLTAGIVGGLGGVAALSGSGSLVGGITAIALLDAVIAGAGELLAGIAGGLNGEASLTGAGSIDAAALTGVADLVAALSGSGEISSALMTVIVQAVATLTGSGGLSGAIVGAGLLEAELVGAGELVSAISALSLIAAVLLGGSLISEANLAGGMNVSADLAGDSSLTALLTAIANLEAEILVGGATVTVDVGAIAAAVLDEIVATHTGDGSLGAVLTEIQGAAGVTPAEVREQVDAALVAYDPATDAKMDEALAALVTVLEQLGTVHQIEVGHWKRVGSQLIYYRADNVTPLIIFNLFKADGEPAGEDDEVFDRVPA